MSNLGERIESWSLVRKLTRRHGRERAMELAVGGDDSLGDRELAVLDRYGFRDGQYLIDVGCGSGRLSRRVGKLPQARYLGTDINRQMLAYAAQTTGRPDFRFERVMSLAIPERDGAADMVCFFSVGTHLMLEAFYAYLLEARRVLKPGGRIVFSFLDMQLEHIRRDVFRPMIDAAQHGVRVSPINVFMDRGAIPAWAEMLEMRLVEMLGGLDAVIETSERVSRALGTAAAPVAFGQSVAVLEKPA